MSTKIKSRKSMAGATQKSAKPKVIKIDKPVTIELEQKEVATADIDFSPLNYRKYYSEEALQDFAKELTVHGIICPLALRPMPSGGYELVAGERRLRGARIAGLPTVPATIRAYTDEEVIEIQLSENLQRENPHPLHEAQAIGIMQRTGKKIDVIAARLGKSKAFVFSRIKLLSLIEAFQEMFLADRLTIREALEIATLPEEAQTDLFGEHCGDWKKDKNFRFFNLSYLLNEYRCDLNRAPFDTKDKKLVEGVGACTACPFNSASLKTLFPEFAKVAVCSNSDCYSKKCTAEISRKLATAFDEYNPEALLFNGTPDDSLLALLEAVPGAGDLPRYGRHEVDAVNLPEKPAEEDFLFDSENDDEPVFDEEGYAYAVDEYNMELEEYNQLLGTVKLLRALLLTRNNVERLLVSTDVTHAYRATPVSRKVTAKELEEAIKNKTATPELLQAGIDRIREREERMKELDKEKVHLTIHEQFTEGIAAVDENNPTDWDRIATRLLIYDSLGFTERQRVKETLFPHVDMGYDTPDNWLDILSELSDSQFSYLVRTAIAAKPESKQWDNFMGVCLYGLAQSAGIDTAAIEKAQQEKAGVRSEKGVKKIADLEKKKGRLEATQRTVNTINENEKE
jgi:ParB family transcriptional regulator, chromosome partitioning protein